VLVWYWHGGSEEYYRKHQFLQPVFGLKFEPEISGVLSMSDTVSKVQIICVKLKIVHTFLIYQTQHIAHMVHTTVQFLMSS